MNQEIVDNVIAIVDRHTEAEAWRDYDATMATFGGNRRLEAASAEHHHRRP
jgi:hypothetical protein